MALFLGLMWSKWASFSQLGKGAETALLKGDTRTLESVAQPGENRLGPEFLTSRHLPNLMGGSFLCLLPPAHCSPFHMQALSTACSSE